MPDEVTKNTNPVVTKAAPVAAPKAVLTTATPPAGEEAPPPRFTIKATDKSGPVQTFAGVKVGDDGVGTTNSPAIAYHCVMSKYDVIDALTGKPYDGTKPKDQPTNA